MSEGRSRFPALLMARRNLRRNRLRSALAALGIVIGVLAIATLGIFGNVLSLSATNELGSIGNQVVISPNADAGFDTLDPRDVNRILRIAEGRGVAVPIKSDGVVIESARGSTFAQLYGTDNPRALFLADDGELPERHRQGVIVGAAVAESLGLQVGSVVDIESNSYRVVAILAESEAISPVQPDNAVVLPEGEFRQERYNQLVVQADTPDDAQVIAREVRDELNARQERVSVFELSSILDSIAEFFALLNAFLLGLASVSLVVAGVSIFNVMLMSTAERREEIGVLRAVGVQRGDVLRTLLVEAALLGAIGGAIGALLSTGIALGLWLFIEQIGLDVILVVSNGVFVVGGFLFGVVVAIVSGLYPAYKAASERPVDALRS